MQLEIDDEGAIVLELHGDRCTPRVSRDWRRAEATRQHNAAWRRTTKLYMLALAVRVVACAVFSLARELDAGLGDQALIMFFALANLAPKDPPKWKHFLDQLPKNLP